MPDSTSGIYVYYEEGLNEADGTTSHTLRQRVYRFIQPDDTTLWANVFIFHHPEQFTNAFSSPELLVSIELDSLVYLRGCHIQFRQTGDNRYEGEHLGDTCPCEESSADYLYSTFVIDAESITRMDSERIRVGGTELNSSMHRFVRREMGLTMN